MAHRPLPPSLPCSTCPSRARGVACRRADQLPGDQDEVRCEVAIDKLLNKNARVADLAELLGFTEASSFVRSFKNWTGTRQSLTRTGCNRWAGPDRDAWRRPKPVPRIVPPATLNRVPLPLSDCVPRNFLHPGAQGQENRLGRCPYRSDDFQQEAGTIFRDTAVIVRVFVGKGRRKLVVACMQFDAVDRVGDLGRGHFIVAWARHWAVSQNTSALNDRHLRYP